MIPAGVIFKHNLPANITVNVQVSSIREKNKKTREREKEERKKSNKKINDCCVMSSDSLCTCNGLVGMDMYVCVWI